MIGDEMKKLLTYGECAENALIKFFAYELNVTLEINDVDRIG